MQLIKWLINAQNNLFAKDNFIYIFLNENDRIYRKISSQYVPGCPINDDLAVVQVIAWYREGGKPLPEPMLTQWRDAWGMFLMI